MSLIIIRGAPGAGKTTYGAKHYPDHVQLAADDFIIGGWTPKKANPAHKKCFSTFKDDIKNGKNVVIHNTFINNCDVNKYTSEVTDFKIIRLYTQFKSIHNVPEDVVRNCRIVLESQPIMDHETIINPDEPFSLCVLFEKYIEAFIRTNNEIHIDMDSAFAIAFYGDEDQKRIDTQIEEYLEKIGYEENNPEFFDKLYMKFKIDDVYYKLIDTFDYSPGQFMRTITYKDENISIIDFERYNAIGLLHIYSLLNCIELFAFNQANNKHGKEIPQYIAMNGPYDLEWLKSEIIEFILGIESELEYESLQHIIPELKEYSYLYNAGKICEGKNAVIISNRLLNRIGLNVNLSSDDTYIIEYLQPADEKITTHMSNREYGNDKNGDYCIYMPFGDFTSATMKVYYTKK